MLLVTEFLILIWVYSHIYIYVYIYMFAHLSRTLLCAIYPLKTQIISCLQLAQIDLKLKWKLASVLKLEIKINVNPKT
jgi:hypothetical protein